jgi:exonuclease III
MKATKENEYFFMVNTIVGGCEVKEKGEKQVRTGNNLNVVHQNIRSLWGKCGELEILLETEINNAKVLCFTEYWLNCHKIHVININHFMLANAFCRRNSDHGGSCIFVKKGVMTKELNFLNELGEEKRFELSVTELVQYAIIITCIYRSPDGKFDTFLNKLELIIQKLIGKHKTLLLCGDWNINFLQTSPQKRELNSLLLQYNLKYIVNVLTRITNTRASLMDVVITYEKKSINSLRVMDLGLSDHHMQILSILIPGFSNIPHRIKKRQFSEANVQEFLYLLKKVNWQEVYEESDVHAKFSTFIGVFLHFYNNVFPIKTVYVIDTIKNKWITQGTKISSKKDVATRQPKEEYGVLDHKI